MNKTIKKVKLNLNKDEILKEPISTDILFIAIQKDTIGKSGSNPTWGEVYSNKDGQIQFDGIAIYKEFDYDYPLAAYGEKTWSIFGKELLGDSIRVPRIDIVEQRLREPEIISYRLLDNDREDMIHIKDILYNKFEREEIKLKKNIFSIDEILECVRLQINDEENYKKIEKDLIQVILLDSITNNADRHALNWGLVRDEKTSEYSLAVFDHASSFVDMFENRAYHLSKGWNVSYITVGNDVEQNNIGSDGKTLIEYINKNYPEYFNDFYEKFSTKLPTILEEVKKEEMRIDFNRLETKMKVRNNFLKKIKERGEIEYGE